MGGTNGRPKWRWQEKPAHTNLPAKLRLSHSLPLEGGGGWLRVCWLIQIAAKATDGMPVFFCLVIFLTDFASMGWLCRCGAPSLRVVELPVCGTAPTKVGSMLFIPVA